MFLTALTYSSSASFPLLEGWDDHVYVSGNTERLVFSFDNILYWLSHPCEGCYLPLTMYSYMLDYAVWGLNGLGYHLQNIFWHIIAVLAVFSIMKWFRISLWLAFALSLVFSIHPQRVESVVWISERKDVMCAAFYFWSIFFWLTEKNKKMTLMLFIAAILSKSMAISLPIIFLMGEYYSENRINLKAWFTKLWPFFIVVLVFIPVTIMSQDINREGISLLRQSYVLLHNVIWYVQMTFFSGGLSPIYPRVILSIQEIFMMTTWYLVFIIAAFAISRGNKTFFKNGIVPLFCCFLVSLAPVAGFLPLGAIDYADRYSYIPSAFLWIMVGELMTNSFSKGPLSEKKGHMINFKLMTYIGILYILLLAFMNFVYSSIWTDYYSVLKAACVHKPPSYMALGALGDIELSRGNYEEAAKIADRIITRPKGLETQKGYAKIILKAKYTKAFASYNLKNKKEALRIFEEIRQDLNVDSFGSAEGYNNMVKMMIDCCNSLGNKEKAEKLKKEIYNK